MVVGSSDRDAADELMMGSPCPPARYNCSTAQFDLHITAITDGKYWRLVSEIGILNSSLYKITLAHYTSNIAPNSFGKTKP